MKAKPAKAKKTAKPAARVALKATKAPAAKVAVKKPAAKKAAKPAPKRPVSTKPPAKSDVRNAGKSKLAKNMTKPGQAASAAPVRLLEVACCKRRPHGNCQGENASRKTGANRPGKNYPI